MTPERPKPSATPLQMMNPLPAETTRNLFMTAYPRMAEIIQLLGSSSLMLLPKYYPAY